MTKFVVHFVDGNSQPVWAEAGDEDDESDGYVFFVDDKSEIVGMFLKTFVKSWGPESR
jgi:hypothetical protein